MNVGDGMTKPPLVAALDSPVRVAGDLMRSKGIRHLPVVDAGAHVLGIVTDRDLRHAAFLPALAGQTGLAPHRVKAPRVRDVMTGSVVTTPGDTPLVRAALTVFQRRIGGLPVVEDGRLVGILTEHDVFTGLTKGSGIEGEAEFFLW